MHRAWYGIALASALALGGCSATNVSELLKALGQDPATVCITVTSVYGTVKGYRTNAMNATVKCDQEGLSVKAGNEGTPMILVPSTQFTPTTPTK